ncbi:MAG: DNA topoisomerase I [Planctomycetaceae bacterium]|nr:DNA topoisomerase I [Planctomycetaceae bacterium]
MAKKSSKSDGKSLVIVESPAKARTIGKYLGKGYTVEASVGHIRDLPNGAKEVPEEFKKEEWAYLGVNVNESFAPVYIVPQTKKQQVSKLKKALKEADQLYLATDEDREGEAISWHLCEVLKPKVPVHRLVFHEITEEAIRDALDSPREIDAALVRAQEARRILDRLYGYDVSQLLWKKVGRGLSAGRVQSVAVRLIVQRERQRMAFRSATYWDLISKLATTNNEEFQAALVSVDGKKIPSGKDFDSSTGKIKDDSFLVLDEAGAKGLVERLRQAKFTITSVESKPYTRKPAPPFTTSTMQQEANRKLGFTARRTMNAAQRLYENGHITYMRTDSTNLASVAVEAARNLVQSEYGSDYLSGTPRTYVGKVKNAQEAHEAIRPAGHPFELPSTLKGQLGSDEYRLFEMIWKRTIASQMVDARGHNTTVTIEGDGGVFRVSGRTIDFPGFLRAYVEGSDNPEAVLADRETLLPAVEQGQNVSCRHLQTSEHTTQPPSRFTEASLTRELEDKGIGRPSTYASIIDTIQAREYVFKKGNSLVPTWTAFAVTRLLEEHFGSLVDYQFTAQMEDYLDAISRQEAESKEYLQDFYFGNEKPGLKAQLDTKLAEIDARMMSRFPVGKPEQGEHTEEVVLRVGRYGPFVEQGERKASLPDGMAPDEMTLEKAMELLEQGAADDEPLGICPDTHKPIFLKVGRFGPYVQLGTPDDDEKPKNASLLKGMEPGDISLEVALRLLSLPRTLGNYPENNEPIVAQNGRFGPYIKCGTDTRSLPADVSPLDVTLEQAIELLKQPKTRGSGRAAPKEPIKVFEKSPVTGEPIKLLDGRYGPYVTDGETNASLPKGTSPDEFSFDQAVTLLAERAAAGGGKKKKKKATKKKSAKKKTTKKAATKKKTAKKADA